MTCSLILMLKIVFRNVIGIEIQYLINFQLEVLKEQSLKGNILKITARKVSKYDVFLVRIFLYFLDTF